MWAKHTVSVLNLRLSLSTCVSDKYRPLLASQEESKLQCPSGVLKYHTLSHTHNVTSHTQTKPFPSVCRNSCHNWTKSECFYFRGGNDMVHKHRPRVIFTLCKQKDPTNTSAFRTSTHERGTLCWKHTSLSKQWQTGLLWMSLCWKAIQTCLAQSNTDFRFKLWRSVQWRSFSGFLCV